MKRTESLALKITFPNKAKLHFYPGQKEILESMREYKQVPYGYRSGVKTYTPPQIDEETRRKWVDA